MGAIRNDLLWIRMDALKQFWITFRPMSLIFTKFYCYTKRSVPYSEPNPDLKTHKNLHFKTYRIQIHNLNSGKSTYFTVLFNNFIILLAFKKGSPSQLDPGNTQTKKVQSSAVIRTHNLLKCVKYCKITKTKQLALMGYR